jgi:carbamoyl-phosphate synthase large subunit
MAIGRTFQESLQKAMRSLEIGSFGFEPRIDLAPERRDQALNTVREKLANPNSQRLWYLADAVRLGMPAEEIYQLSRFDPWFVEKVRKIVATEGEIARYHGKFNEVTAATMRRWKQMGFADPRLADLVGTIEEDVRRRRKSQGIEAVFCSVDTCGAEFKAFTPYLYSTYEGEDESKPTQRKKIMILGGGPNRIGQGIEFDYCCVHAAFALKEDGYEHGLRHLG